MINETKNMNVPLKIKSLFLSLIKAEPYDKIMAAAISMIPVIPESIFNKLPHMKDNKYEITTTRIITAIVLFRILIKSDEVSKPPLWES